MGKKATEVVSPFIESLMHRLREGGAIIVGAIAVYFLMALITFHASDPSWTSTGSGGVVANAGGRVGAWISDIFLALFGYVSYLIPVLLGYIAWRGFRREYEYYFHWGIFGLQSLGFCLIFMSACGLESLAFASFASGLPQGVGGIFGHVIASGFGYVFNSMGSALILISSLLLGSMLFFEMSWAQVLESAGRGLCFVGVKIWHGILGLCGSLKDRAIAANLARIDRKNARQDGSINDGVLANKQGKASKQLNPAISNRVIHSQPKMVEPVFDESGLSARGGNVEPIFDDAPGSGSSQSMVDRDAMLAKAKQKRANKSAKAISKVASGVEINEPAQSGPLPVFSTTPTEGLPGFDLLDQPKETKGLGFSKERLESLSNEVELRLADFGVKVSVVAVHPGPVVTRFEMELAPGIKASKITTLGKDLARSLSVASVRVVEIIPGKPVVGLEIPNEYRETVCLREILQSKQYQQAKSPLSMALGKDISGHPVIVDLVKMPHLLAAGTTGSGKSVSLNAMLLSILYKATPEEVRMILIDPKMLELSIYENIPHLLTPVVTDMKEAANSLRWCVAEMDRRYRLMSQMGVRNLAGFNAKVREAKDRGEPIKDPMYQPPAGEEPIYLEPLPLIMVLIDEFADMMMVVGKKVEELIARIAQKARAAGIHLILATQRPSVDVITGLIKANVPTRIAFQTSSRIDSRTILDQQGAEQLLGYGDMLYMAPGTGMPVRVHGAFVDDDEVHRVVEDWKSRGTPNYITDILQERTDDGATPTAEEDAEQDVLYDQAVAIVAESRRASISYVQRRLKIGYNRSARLLEAMEAAGVVSPMESNGTREVLVPEYTE